MPSISGPKRPQDKVFLTESSKEFAKENWTKNRIRINFFIERLVLIVGIAVKVNTSIARTKTQEVVVDLQNLFARI